MTNELQEKLLTIHTVAFIETSVTSPNSPIKANLQDTREKINTKCTISFWYQALIKYFALFSPAGWLQL